MGDVMTLVEKAERTWDEQAAEAAAEAAPPRTDAQTIVLGAGDDRRGLFDIIDVDDPIAVGEQETYVIDVTNQGSAPTSNIVVQVTLPKEQSFVSAEGPAGVEHSVSGRVITFDPLAQLPPSSRETYKVVAKTLEAGDVIVIADLMTDQLDIPLRVKHSTHQFIKE